MSDTTLYSPTIIPGEGNDTVTIPRSFYGQPMWVAFHPLPKTTPVDSTPAQPPTLPESLRKKLPKFTKEQFEALGNSPRMKAFSGILKNSGLPPDITMREIREMRLKEKYGS